MKNVFWLGNDRAWIENRQTEARARRAGYNETRFSRLMGVTQKPHIFAATTRRLRHRFIPKLMSCGVYACTSFSPLERNFKIFLHEKIPVQSLCWQQILGKKKNKFLKNSDYFKQRHQCYNRPIITSYYLRLYYSSNLIYSTMKLNLDTHSRHIWLLLLCVTL